MKYIPRNDVLRRWAIISLVRNYFPVLLGQGPSDKSNVSLDFVNMSNFQGLYTSLLCRKTIFGSGLHVCFVFSFEVGEILQGSWHS